MSKDSYVGADKLFAEGAGGSYAGAVSTKLTAEEPSGEPLTNTPLCQVQRRKTPCLAPRLPHHVEGRHSFMSIMTASALPMRTAASIVRTYAKSFAVVLGVGLIACIILALSVQDVVAAAIVFAAIGVTAAAYAALGYVCARATTTLVAARS